MRYTEFRDCIQEELRRSPSGLTWNQLRERLDLPYIRACPEWTKHLEQEIGLLRVKDQGRAYLWRLSSKPS